MGDILSTLCRIEELLRNYGHCEHADFVAMGRKNLLEGGVNVFSTLASLEWWGGAGSVADVYLYCEVGRPDGEQKEDNRALRSLLIDVYAAMQANGVEMKRAAFWTATFKNWKEQGI